MSRYTLADRRWVPGPAGVLISIIPGRAVCGAVELPEMPKVFRPNPPGATIRYLVDYLTRHGSATTRQMAPADDSILQSTISSCLSSNPRIFVGLKSADKGKFKVWKLRGQP